MTIDPSPFRPFAADRPGPVPDPLPAWFEPELIEVDARLRDAAEEAAKLVIPIGLNDRVFTASAKLLPARRTVAGRRLRLAPADALRHSALQRQWLGRLAMAASLGLVFTVAMLSMQPSLTTAPEPIARSDTMLAAYASVLSEDPRASVNDDSAYLVDTMAIRSKDDVRNEMLAILDEF